MPTQLRAEPRVAGDDVPGDEGKHGLVRAENLPVPEPGQHEERADDRDEQKGRGRSCASRHHGGVYRYTSPVTLLAVRSFVLLLLAFLVVLPAVSEASPFEPTPLDGISNHDDLDPRSRQAGHPEIALAEAVPAMMVTTVAIGAAPDRRCDAPHPVRALPFHRRGPPLA